MTLPSPSRLEEPCPWLGTSDVHTLRFAFCAPQVDDESVKMSNTTAGRSSALPAALSASRPRVNPPPKRQLLFNTNESFAFISNFSTLTKQSTSFFLFNTNERSPITTHQSLLRDSSTGRRPRCALVYTHPTSTAHQLVVGWRAMECPGSAQRGRDVAPSCKRLRCHGFEIFR